MPENIQTIVSTVALLVGAGGFGALVKTILDHLRARRKASDDVAMALVGRLSTRVESLEASSLRERELCDAQLSVLRHRMNNMSSLFDGVLWVLKAAPDKAASLVADIERRRAEQERAEAIEKAALAGAKIAAAGEPANVVEAAE